MDLVVNPHTVRDPDSWMHALLSRLRSQVRSYIPRTYGVLGGIPNTSSWAKPCFSTWSSDLLRIGIETRVSFLQLSVPRLALGRTSGMFPVLPVLSCFGCWPVPCLVAGS